MKKSQRPANSRRNFLQRFTAGSLAIVAGAVPVAKTAVASVAQTTAPSDAIATLDDKWLERIHGDHRQVFDIVEPNGGLGAAYAMNYLASFKEVHHVSDDEVCAVTVFRHKSFPLTLNDAMWKKYKIGEFLDITDPETKAHAVRNIFHNNIPLRPGLTYEKMISERKVVIVACNMALTFLSSFMAKNAGVSAEEAKAEWTDNLLDGVILVPSGVYAVNRAQARRCTYCYGG